MSSPWSTSLSSRSQGPPEVTAEEAGLGSSHLALCCPLTHTNNSSCFVDHTSRHSLTGAQPWGILGAGVAKAVSYGWV